MNTVRAWNMGLFFSIALVLTSMVFSTSALGKEGLEEISDEFAVISARAQSEGSNVEFIIIDPKGRRLGFDPRTNEYSVELVGAYDRPWFWNSETDKAELVSDPDVTEKSGKAERPESYTTFAEFSLVPGEYTVEVVGMGLTQFSLGILMSRGNAEESVTFHTGGLIDREMGIKYRFTYNADAKNPVGNFEKIVTTSGLKQELALFQKNGWISRKDVAKSLMEMIAAAENSMSKGNNLEAREQLQAFIEEIRASGRKAVAEDKSRTLIDDARYLADSLCGPPVVLMASSQHCR